MDLDMNTLQTIAAACVGLAQEEVEAALATCAHADKIRDVKSLAAKLCELATMV